MIRKLTICMIIIISSAVAGWVSFDNMPGPVQPTIDIISGGRDQLTLSITIHGMWVEDSIVNGVVYQVLSIPSCPQIPDPGQPMLPYISKLIAIAPRLQVHMDLDSLQTIVLEGYYIFPAQYPQYGDTNLPFVIDTMIYRQNAFYPQDTTDPGRPAIFRDLRVTNLSFFPISFNPRTRKLNIINKAILTADFTAPDTINTLPDWPSVVSDRYNAIYASTIFNYSTLHILSNFIPMKYLIISDNYFVSALNPFIFWKKKKGIDVYLQTVYLPTANQIKSIITNYYLSCGIDYVLLIGDGYEREHNQSVPSPLLPIPLGWSIITPPSRTISDYWYATITPDDIADVAVGRFSVWTTAQLTTVINKTFAFERYPDEAEWFIKRNDLVSWKDPIFLACKIESIAPMLNAHGFNYFNDYGGSIGITNELLKSHINNQGPPNGSSLLNYRGHGTEQAWDNWNLDGQYFTNADIYSLTNYVNPNTAWLPIVFEICCLCGHAGDSLPDTTCHSECWFRHTNGGAVAALGASVSTQNGPNDKLDAALYRVSFGPALSGVIVDLGWTINTAKVNMASAYGWSPFAIDHMRVYHLMGDPEVDIYTGWDGYMTAVHPAQINTGHQNFLVRVYDSENTLLPGALVCLYKKDDIFKTIVTDVNGEALFDISPATRGTLYVTVTKHNYGPYEGVCMVIQTRNPVARQGNRSLIIDNIIYNPRTNSVIIACQISNPDFLEITIYDISGRLIKKMIRNIDTPGCYNGYWDCHDSSGLTVGKGVYFMRIKSTGTEVVRKVVLH